MTYPPFPTNKVPFTLDIGIMTNSPQEIKFQARDSAKPLTYYVSHKHIVDRRLKNGKYYREFELKFPQVPALMEVSIYNTAVGNLPRGVIDQSFVVTKFKAKPLVSKIPYDVWLSPQDASFLKLAQRFCENASFLSATIIQPNGLVTPSIYQSDDLKFSIDYYNEIVDKKTKQVINTPARIGHDSGTIEVSKSCFMKYTIPMRMIILLHEYSHKYNNPLNGYEIRNEKTADISALNMYLSLGYSEVEALLAFATVFKGANTPENQLRLKINRDFVGKFLAGTLPTTNSSRSSRARRVA